jgi:ribulose bisphosphate carboxylase small subunit
MAYYIAPRFLDKISIHITKNYLTLPNVRVPLILGIHGRKGEGKSFQCELAFQTMGVEVVHISAGELESPDAGEPSRLIRLRYREAAELVKVRGKMAVLMINDLDAGAGRVDQSTQYTVNTQLVNATLMNIADNPTNVQLPGSYEAEPIQRIPIIATGNDFATLYAPLIRDGRMEKFYWEPNHDDRIGIVSGIFEVDHVSRADIQTLVDTFPDQSIDFYSALRSRLYDEQVRQLIQDVGIEKIGRRIVNSAEKPPEFRKPNFSLPHLIETGYLLVHEQDRIREMRLMQEYNVLSHSVAPGTEHAAPRSQPETRRETGRTRRTPSTVEAVPLPATRPSTNGHNPNLNQDTLDQVHHLATQGYRIGIEYVDPRRFRTNSWNCYAAVQGNEQEAIATLQSCLAEHREDYVRIVGIEPNARKRVVETIIQRPQ